MLERKIRKYIEDFLGKDSNKVLIVDGARQIGKSFIIRHVGQQMFDNYIEINMQEDALQNRLFADARTKEDFYLRLSTIAGDRMKERENTLVFIDEIQTYDHLLTMLKFLKEDNRFTYIASGSLLGVTLKQTPSIPIGSIEIKHMYPLDFEEFLMANGVGELALNAMHEAFEKEEALPDALHNRMMDLFRKYLLVGGLPDAVNSYLSTMNIAEVRSIHQQIRQLYALDASKYEAEHGRRLKIQRIYEMIPSNLENKKKRVVAKEVEGKRGKRMTDYQDEFDYLISSGIALEVKAISKPCFPLVQNSGKNLLKLYLNDVGVFTSILYRNSIQAVMDDSASVNLGAVYEAVVAQELCAHGYGLYYYDNKQKGEVDFLIDDVPNLSVMPIKVKSGKDYHVHSALNHFISTEEYGIHKSYVLSNQSRVYTENAVTYLPIYYIMFF